MKIPSRLFVLALCVVALAASVNAQPMKGAVGAPDKADSTLATAPPVVGSAQFGDGSVFEIRDFSFGVENPTTIGSATGGAGAGKVKFNEFTIKKTIDKASPAFFRACATGSHYAKVTITVRKSGGDTTFDFGTVFVSGIKWVPADGPANSLEEITFLAGSMKVTADGSVSCWDQVLNKSCDGSL